MQVSGNMFLFPLESSSSQSSIHLFIIGNGQERSVNWIGIIYCLKWERLLNQGLCHAFISITPTMAEALLFITIICLDAGFWCYHPFQFFHGHHLLYFPWIATPPYLLIQLVLFTSTIAAPTPLQNCCPHHKPYVVAIAILLANVSTIHPFIGILLQAQLMLLLPLLLPPVLQLSLAIQEDLLLFSFTVSTPFSCWLILLPPVSYSFYLCRTRENCCRSQLWSASYAISTNQYRQA